MSIKRIAHQKRTKAPTRHLEKPKEFVKHQQQQREAAKVQEELTQRIRNGITAENYQQIKSDVKTFGTKTQRKAVESYERSLNLGYTQEQWARAELFNEYHRAANKAGSIQDLEALESRLGNMAGNTELRNIISNRKSEIRAKVGNAKPTPSSGKTYAELYENFYGTKAPAIDVSGVVKAERNAAPILEANARIAAQASEIEQLRGGITQYQGIVHSQTIEIFDKEAEIARQIDTITTQADTIATQTDTIAQQANKMTQQGQTIQKLSKANKFLKFGAIAAVVGLVGLAGYMIYDKMKNKNQDIQDVPQGNNTQPVEHTPVQEQEEPVVAQQDTVVAQQDTVPAGNPDFTRLVKPGDNIWNYVTEQLTKEYGRVPTNQETLDGVRKYMQKHNIPLEDDNYTAIIEPGDSLFQVEA